MKNLKHILLSIIVIIICISILLCIIKEKYEFAIAIAGIFIPTCIPFFTTDIEINKHKQEIIINDKCTCYKELYSYLSSIAEYPFGFYTKETWDKQTQKTKQEEYKFLNATNNNYDYEIYKIHLLNASLAYQKEIGNKLQEYIKSNGLYVTENIKNELKKLNNLIHKYRNFVALNNRDNDNMFRQIQNQTLLIKNKLQEELNLDK